MGMFRTFSKDCDPFFVQWNGAKFGILYVSHLAHITSLTSPVAQHPLGRIQRPGLGEPTSTLTLTQTVSHNPIQGPPNLYAEWYDFYMRTPPNASNPTWEHHLNTYGTGVDYEDFIANFTAAKFDAGAWVDLFDKAGAKYFVLVTVRDIVLAFGFSAADCVRDYCRNTTMDSHYSIPVSLATLGSGRTEPQLRIHRQHDTPKQRLSRP
jgi:hypothetical protein